MTFPSYDSLHSRCRRRALGKIGKRKGGGGEGAAAIRAPIGPILRSLTTVKFRLVNQTIGGAGHHSLLTWTSYRFSRLERRRHLRIHLKTGQEIAVRVLLDWKDVFSSIADRIWQNLNLPNVCTRQRLSNEWQSNDYLLFHRWLAL